MLKEWFILICAVLAIAFINLLLSFDFSNALHGIYLAGLTAAITLSALVYLDQPHKKDIAKLQKTYSDFLREKDNKISELKREAGLMFRTAAKRAEKDLELEELKKKLEEKTT